MDNPLVSVITVTYNSALYIREAMESVLEQNYTNIEYIIGDDCSTDETWNIIQEYKDPRIKSYRNEKNIREYPNRNKALRMVTGKYLLFIDGDDIVYPHGLMYMVKMLEAFPDSAIAVVGNDYDHFIYPLEFTPEEMYKFQFFSKGFLSYSMVGNLFRTDVLKENGGFPVQYISGDYYTRLKICGQHKCLIIGGNPVWARVTLGQASSLINTLKGHTELIRMDKDFITHPLSPLNEKDKQQALLNLFHPVAKKIIRDLATFNWANAMQLKKSLGWGWSEVKKYYSAIPDRSFRSEYDSTRVLKMDFSKNPFSRNYRQ